MLLMTNLRNLMICEEAAVACAKRRDAVGFVLFMLEQMSVHGLNTCAMMLREGTGLAQTFLLNALWNIQQSKLLRVNMKEPVELEPLRKIDEF